MIVCGLDISLTSAGIAKLRNGRPVLLTTVGHKGGDSTSWTNRINRITSQAQAICAAAGRDCDLVVIEAPLTFTGGPNTGAAYDRYAVFIGIGSQLMRWGVPFAVVPNATRCKWATGKGGKASRETTRAEHKRQVLAAVRDTWHPWRSRIRNDDIGDAVTLAEMGARYVGDALHFGPLRRHVEALGDVHWPEGVKE